MARTKKQADRTDAPDDWGTPVAGTPTLASEKSMADVLRDDDRAKGQPGRGRIWLILLTSLIAQLVVIGAAGNPGVVGSASDYAREHTSLLGRFAQLPSVVSWRIQQPTVDPGNLLVSEWFGLLALVVLAAILTAVLVRGPVTFWRTGVAVWLAVIVATLANGMVRRGVVNDRGSFDDLGGKAGGVLFAGTGYEVIAGVVIGLVAAIVAAIVAVVTRKPAEVVLPAAADEPAPYVEPASPPPWHGDDLRDDAANAADEQPTYATRSYAAPYEAAYGAGAGAAASGSASDSATTALPAQRGSDDWRDAEVTTQFAGVSGTSGASAYERPATEPATEVASEPDVEPVSEPAASETVAASEPAPSEPAADQTAVLPAVPAEPAAPAEPAVPAEPAAPVAPHSDFPRPPDDEDFGHHPSEDDADRADRPRG